MSKVCFLLLVHNDPAHFGRLVSALSRVGDIVVHVDKKTSIDSYVAAAGNNKKVRFLGKRVSVSWAGISMVDAQIELLKFAASEPGGRYKYYIFLSGSCFPIKSPDYIKSFFDSNENDLIRFVDMRESPDVYYPHIIRRWFNEPVLGDNRDFIFNRIARKFLQILKLKNHWPEDIVPFFGSQWIALTESSVNYTLSYIEDNPMYRSINKYTFSPDEHFFHTIIGNSKLNSARLGKCKYEGRGTWRMANFHVIDKSLSKWFTIEDFPELEKTTALFVRKVRSKDGLDLVRHIESIFGY